MPSRLVFMPVAKMRDAFSWTSRRSVNFSNTASAALGLTAAQTSFNDFAVGLINTSTLRSGSTLAHYRRYPMDTFLQDQWKILPNLTLNLGIRYELPSAIYELDDRAANLIAGQGVTLFGSNSVLDIDTTKVGPSSVIYHPGVGRDTGWQIQLCDSLQPERSSGEERRQTRAGNAYGRFAFFQRYGPLHPQRRRRSSRVRRLKAGPCRASSQLFAICCVVVTYCRVS
jgi:hypothetical protein